MSPSRVGGELRLGPEPPRKETFELDDEELLPTLGAFERSDSCPNSFSGVA